MQVYISIRSTVYFCFLPVIDIFMRKVNTLGNISRNIYFNAIDIVSDLMCVFLNSIFAVSLLCYNYRVTCFMADIIFLS